MTSILENDIVYCDAMLPKVSRTFAPTIRMLPAGLNTIVTVAYLLCRIADTVEDSEDISVDKKKELLDYYINIFKTASRLWIILLMVLQFFHKTLMMKSLFII